MIPVVKKCAIYTRKSTEEGLDQNFNSLDAQREACLAYITSQKAEGWAPAKSSYDDGGYSGGNIERPGLQKLLEDIKAGKINIIVVYKIDRLTRSLMDFAKLVELFDQHQVTFVSVTQSFNTTTSMGRLTLNVLLSFAQFEREVTGERIRDKIAASKKKGLWMGGNVPLGYYLKDRNLYVNEKEAGLVRKIFKTYLEVRSVIKLKDFLKHEGDKTKSSNDFTRGMLYFLLANPIYIGKIKHKTKVYDGHHAAIVSPEDWSAAQEILVGNAIEPRGRKKLRQQHLLSGLIFDEGGIVYSPVFTNKNGQRYNYYVSQDKIQRRKNLESIPLRIPAKEIETYVEKKLREGVQGIDRLAEITGYNCEIDHEALENLYAIIEKMSIENLFAALSKIVIGPDNLNIHVSVSRLKKILQTTYGLKLRATENTEDTFCLAAPFTVGKSWHGSVVIRPPAKGTPEDMFDLPAHDLRDLIRGFIWRDEHFKGMTIREIAKRDKRSDAFVGGMIRKTFEVA